MIIPLSIQKFSVLPLRVMFLRKTLRLLVLTGILPVLLPVVLIARSPIFYESNPIQERINSIKHILEGLPVSPTITNPWTLGYSSAWDDLPENILTIEIQFERPEIIDLVAILPSVFIDDNNGRQSFGFPLRFSIEQLLTTGEAQMISNYLDKDYPLVGMGPELFPCTNPIPTRGLRITVTQRRQNPMWWPTSHVVSMSEVFAFAGQSNIALHGKVTASSSFNLVDAWSPSNLTDGFSLFSQIHRKLNDPSKFFRKSGNEVRLEMDLGKERQIGEIRFWPDRKSVV